MSSTDPTPGTLPKILFVCLGNICRSPMAEGAFRAAAKAAGLECEVSSAGTADYHIGQPPDPRAIEAAAANGVDISWLYGAQIKREDYYTYTHILALDAANLAGIMAHAPRDATAHVALFMDAVEGRKGEPIKDPYHGDQSDFEEVWEEVTLAAEALVARLSEHGAAARF